MKIKPPSIPPTGQVSAIDTSNVVDYTALLRPCEEWPMILKGFPDWFERADATGVDPVDRVMKKLQLRKHEMGRPDTNKRMMEELEAMHRNQERIKLYSNPSLPYPKPGEYSYGYTWTAWSYAAQCAGAKRPVATLTEISDLVEANLDYAVSCIKEWRRNPQQFADDVNELLARDSGRTEITPRDTDGVSVRQFEANIVGYRVADIFHLAFLMQEARESLARLEELGTRNSGREALKQARTDERIRTEFKFLDVLFWWRPIFEKEALQRAFKMFRDPNIVRGRTSGPRSIATHHMNFDITLTSSWETLYKKSYLDFTLAGLAGFFDQPTTSREYRTLGTFAEHTFEYEQALRKTKEVVHPYLQKLIGETAMRSNTSSALDSIYDTVASEQEMFKLMTPSHAHDEYKDRVMRRSTCAEELFTNHKGDRIELPHDGHFDAIKAEHFWNHWMLKALKMYGRTLEDVLELRGLLEPITPRWSPVRTEPNSIASNTTTDNFGVNSQPLAQSAHLYLRGQIRPTIKNKNKSRGAGSVHEPSAEPSASETIVLQSPVISPTFTVNNKQLKLLNKLFSASGDQDGQGQVRWEDIFNLMKRLRFRVEEVGGSIVRFVPPDNAGMPFSEHRPHPEDTIGAIRYRSFGQKLRERYGWSADWFARASEVEVD
ncbi:hypothetical protein IAU59_002358 [Kwoniella sp. CBS 9459]